MNYFICGFMGCGKSTVLRELRAIKELDHFKFIDLDDFIYQQFCEQADSLGELIDKLGFPRFRELEIENLNKLSRTKNTVLALGGGTLNSKTMKVIMEKGWSGHWLDTDFETCLARIRKEEGTRPLSRKTDEQLQDLYLERKGQYSTYQSFSDSSQILEILKTSPVS
jgi:shikimate kinase